MDFDPEYIKVPVFILSECKIHIPLLSLFHEFFIYIDLHPYELVLNAYQIIEGMMQMNFFLRKKLTTIDILYYCSILRNKSLDDKYYSSLKCDSALIYYLSNPNKDVDYMLIFSTPRYFFVSISHFLMVYIYI